MANSSLEETRLKESCTSQWEADTHSVSRCRIRVTQYHLGLCLSIWSATLMSTSDDFCHSRRKNPEPLNQLNVREQNCLANERRAVKTCHWQIRQTTCWICLISQKGSVSDWIGLFALLLMRFDCPHEAAFYQPFKRGWRDEHVVEPKANFRTDYHCRHLYMIFNLTFIFIQTICPFSTLKCS